MNFKETETRWKHEHSEENEEVGELTCDEQIIANSLV
jgi:hypothetical protein